MQQASPCWIFPKVGVGDLVFYTVGTSLSAIVYSGLRRKVLYQRAPRNIHRHVILSEIKEAVAALPSVREDC